SPELETPVCPPTHCHSMCPANYKSAPTPSSRGRTVAAPYSNHLLGPQSPVGCAHYCPKPRERYRGLISSQNYMDRPLQPRLALRRQRVRHQYRESTFLKRNVHHLKAKVSPKELFAHSWLN